MADIKAGDFFWEAGVRQARGAASMDKVLRDTQRQAEKTAKALDKVQVGRRWSGPGTWSKRQNVDRVPAGVQPNQSGFFRKLRGRLGEGSEIGLGLNTLRGAGAIAAVTLLTRGLGNAAENAAELSKQFRAGEISAGDMWIGVAKGIPIIGDLTRVAEGLTEILFGGGAADAKRKQMMDEWLKGLEDGKTAMEGIADARSSMMNKFVDERQGAGDRRRLAGLGGSDKELAELDIKHRDQAQKIRVDYTEAWGAVQNAMKMVGLPKSMVEDSQRVIDKYRDQRMELNEQEHAWERIGVRVRDVAGSAGDFLGKVMAWNDGMQEASKSAEEIRDGLRRKIATFGKGDMAESIMELAQRGASPEVLKEIEKLSAQWEGMNAKVDVPAAAERQRDSAASITGVVDAIDQIQTAAFRGGDTDKQIAKWTMLTAKAAEKQAKATDEGNKNGWGLIDWFEQNLERFGGLGA